MIITVGPGDHITLIYQRTLAPHRPDQIREFIDKHLPGVDVAVMGGVTGVIHRPAQP